VHADYAEPASVSQHIRLCSRDTRQTSAAGSLALTVSSACQLDTSSRHEAFSGIHTVTADYTNRKASLTLDCVTIVHCHDCIVSLKALSPQLT